MDICSSHKAAITDVEAWKEDKLDSLHVSEAKGAEISHCEGDAPYRKSITYGMDLHPKPPRPDSNGGVPSHFNSHELNIPPKVGKEHVTFPSNVADHCTEK